jgi:hypothetical protein
MQPAQLDLEKLPASNDNNLVTRLKGKLSLETVHNFIQTLRRNIGQSFAIASLTQQGMAVLQVAGLAKLLPNFPTVEAALAAKN